MSETQPDKKKDSFIAWLNASTIGILILTVCASMVITSFVNGCQSTLVNHMLKKSDYTFNGSNSTIVSNKTISIDDSTVIHKSSNSNSNTTNNDTNTSNSSPTIESSQTTTTTTKRAADVNIKLTLIFVLSQMTVYLLIAFVVWSIFIRKGHRFGFYRRSLTKKESKEVTNSLHKDEQQTDGKDVSLVSIVDITQ